VLTALVAELGAADQFTLRSHPVSPILIFIDNVLDVLGGKLAEIRRRFV
jgi:hypothetical protein